MADLSELDCPICHETMENPKTIPCQHTACEQCLCQWVGEKGALICPLCITLSPLPQGGVPALPTNIILRKLCDSLRDKQSEPDEETSAAVAKKGGGSTSKKKKPTIKVSEISLMNDKNPRIKPMVGWPVRFLIKVCEDEGELMPILATPSGDKVELNIVKRQGKTLVQFIPKSCGLYEIDVKQSGRSIKNAPLPVPIKPRCNRACDVYGCLKGPRDVVVTEKNGAFQFIVSDGVRHSIAITDPFGRETGRLFSPKKGDKEFSPMGLALSDDDIYVTDMNNQCVHIFRNNKWYKKFGSDNIIKPTGIAVDKTGVIYVADSAQGQILIFNSSHFLVKSFSSPKDRSPNQLKSPEFMTLDQNQNKLIVCDVNCNNIKIFDVHHGTLSQVIETRLGQDIARPVGVTVDHADNIYVSAVTIPSLLPADSEKKQTKPKTKSAIITYTRDGTFLNYVVSDALKNPKGIRVVGGEGGQTSSLIFVCDSIMQSKEGKGPGGKGAKFNAEVSNNGIKGFEV